MEIVMTLLHINPQQQFSICLVDYKWCCCLFMIAG